MNKYLDRIPNSNLDIAFEGSIIEEEFIQEFGSLLDDLFEEEEDIK